MADKTVPLPPLTPAEAALFESLIEVDTRTGCWLWKGGKFREGYGYFNLAYWGIARAHRISYAREYGDTPEHLDHLCHDPSTCPGGPTCPHRACVNPKHLQPASKRANVLRGGGPSAINFRKTHCVNGHEFTASNTFYDAGGWRQCRTCRNERQAARVARNREQINARKRELRAAAKVSLDPRPCKECGTLFDPPYKNSSFCTVNCGQRFRHRRRQG